MNEVKVVSEMERALELSRERHWEMRVLRIDKTFDNPPAVYIPGEIFNGKGAILVERSRNKSIIVPPEADERLEEMFRQRFPIEVEYVGRPEIEEAPEEVEEVVVVQPRNQGLLDRLDISTTTAVIIGALAILAAPLVIPIVVGVCLLLVAGSDPNLVVVFQSAEGYVWLEIARWNEEAE